MKPALQRFSSAVVLAALTIVVCTATAQQPDKPVQDDLRPMTRAQALQMAAERNYGVMVERLATKAADENTALARLTYIPTLNINASYFDNAAQNARPAQSGADLTGLVNWNTPWGMALTAGLTSNGRFAGALNPASTALFMAASQSLLRGGFEAGAFTPALEADVQADVQRQRLRQTLNDLLVQVEAAYWELAFAQTNVEGRLRSLERARAQYEDTRENIDRGLLAEADIFIVEENVVLFEDQWVRAKESLKLARSRLAQLLQLGPGVWPQATDSLEQALETPPSLMEASRVALQNNPAVRVQHLLARLANIRLSFNENQALPSLDLEASLRLNGQGEGFGEAYGESFAADQPDWRVGVVFEVPLWWSGNAARVARSELDVEQRLVDVKDIEQQVQFDIQERLINFDTLTRRLELAQKRLKLAQGKLDAQMERYRNGISTLDEVVRFQRDLDSALIAEQRVRVELLRARSLLLQAQGTLHDVYGVGVE
mgnify:CR=1 FL=1